MTKDRWVCVGLITRPVGVSGDVKIRPYTTTAEVFRSFKEFFLDSQDGMSSVTLTCSGVDGIGHITARVAGCDSRDAAEGLRMRGLHVRRSALPELGGDEHYLEDLRGLAVLGAGGAQIGRVLAAQDFGAGAFLEVMLAKGGRAATVPFREGAVLSVDLEAGTVQVDEAFVLS